MKSNINIIVFKADDFNVVIHIREMCKNQNISYNKNKCGLRNAFKKQNPLIMKGLLVLKVTSAGFFYNF